MSKLCGIYCVTHVETGRKYVGQSRDIAQRWKWHRHSKHYFGAALRKYGADAFAFEVLEQCSQSALNERERYWIASFGCVAPAGFNMNTGGDAPEIVCDETRARIGQALRGRSRPRNLIEATAAAHRGMKRGDETRAKISAALAGKKRGPRSQETIEKVAACHRGRKRSAETRERISVAMAGKKRPAISAAMAGRKRPDISAALSGRVIGPMSEERKAKLSAARTGLRLSDEAKAERRAKMAAKREAAQPMGAL